MVFEDLKNTLADTIMDLKPALISDEPVEFEMVTLDRAEKDNGKWLSYIMNALKDAKTFEIHCWNEETEWVELSGHGTLKSFVVPGIQNDKPYLKAIAPYGYGAVQLDEGPIYSVVVFAGKKKIVKGLQQRLADGEVIGVHFKPIAREVPLKAGSDEMVPWSQPCFELDEVAE